MHTNYKTEATIQLAREIKKAGFRVFIAASGTYGFYTDALGQRVVQFQFDLGGFTFNGNYKTDQPSQTGTGWRLEGSTFTGMFNQCPPDWAVRSGITWKFTTLEQYLKTYQSSSKFTEVE